MKIGFLSDAHGNYDGFMRGLEILSKLGAERIFFLGDAVGYINSVKVLKYLSQKSNNIQSILGNHDLMLISGGVPSSKDKMYQLNRIRKRIDSSSLHFLKSLPLEINQKVSCGNMHLVHGAPDDAVHGYVYPDPSLEKYNAVDSDYVFMGNTHRPFVRQVAGKFFVNVGSCGLSRDIGYLGAVCILDVDQGIPKIYRYDMTDINKKIMSRYRLHPDVRQLFTRECDSYCGVKIDY